MPDISGLNGGVVKATPEATDVLPIQEVGGLTKPVSIASVASVAASLVPIATPSVAGKMSAADKLKLDGLSSGGGGGGGGAGSIGATTNGTNPATPAIGTIATYNVVASSGLAVGQYYAFNGVSGTFLCTSTPSATTANFQNIDGTVGVAIADATKIIATGKTGAAGAAGAAGGTSSWSLKTANYTAMPGDKLRLDATASDIVITLPSTPYSTDADILFQRLELGANKVLLRTGINKINAQANQDGVFAPATINLIEGISYINSAIGWLNQHNRLTFQAYTPPAPPANTDPLFSSVALLLNFDTNYADSSSNLFTVIPNSQAISSTVKQWGAGSARLDGASSYITLPTSAVLNRGVGDYCIELWFNQIVGASNVQRNIFNAPGGSANGLGIDANRRLVFWVDGLGNLITGTPPQLAEGVFHYVGISRYGSSVTIWVDNASYATFNNTTAYDFSGWLIGNNIYSYIFNGFIDDFRLTTVARTISGSPTAAFPTS